MKFKDKNEISLPKEFKLNDTKDRYYWYVVKGPICEELFWNADVAFINGILINDTAYENWKDWQIHLKEK